MGQGAAAKKIALTALERLDRLEQTVSQLFQAIGSTFGTVEGRFNTTEETLTAVVGLVDGLVGTDAVANAIKEARRETELAQEIAAKASLAEAVAKGKLVTAEVVSEKSVVIGRELTAEGKPIGYVEGRVQLFIDRIIPDVRTALLGQKVGFEIETPQKGKFIVSEIYDVVEAPPAEETKAAEEDVTKAVEADLAPVGTAVPAEQV